MVWACRSTAPTSACGRSSRCGPPTGIAFRIRSEIPLAAGLGSSAAAIVAGLLAADHLYELAQEPEDVLVKAAKIEGHPDNVAAALYGGFVICGGDEGALTSTRLDPPQGVEAVVVIPAEQVPTEEARKAIPAEVPLADAIANISAASELVLGIQRSDLTLIGRGLADRLAPAAQGAPLPALDGDRRGGSEDGRDRGDDLGGRAGRARLDLLAEHR